MTEIPTEGELAPLNKLKAYGYTSAEEIFYLAQALGPELTEMVGVAPLRLQAMLRPTLALLPPAVAAELGSKDYALGVPLQLAPPPPVALGAAPVPTVGAANVDLIAQMPPIRDQNPRGTCVAHAALAVVEHAFAQIGAPTDLSEQFLYWNCKRNDGIPAAEGTYLNVAFPLLARDGVCPELDWPYVRIGCTTEDCGPPPAGALVNALTYRTPVTAVPANSITDIKGHLSDGRCVAFSIPVFRSWYRSDLVRAEGKINMPVPNDINEGGHAMCLVGYADSHDAGLGGGRFLLRNSWGDWAPLSPYGPGYGSIPYAYIQRYCQEAYTVAEVTT